MKNIIGIFILLWLTSCFKEDEMVQPHEPGDVETAMIALTKNYSNQVFFDLGLGQSVMTSAKLNWDLGFEPGNNGWRIFLNTTRFMQGAATGSKIFESVKDTIGMSWRFDVSSGNPDSTAIGRWFNVSAGDTLSRQEVFILDMGYDANGNMLGFRKMQVIAWDQSSYTIRYAKLDGLDEQTQIISKQSDQDMICYSLRDHRVAVQERPSLHAWDLWFTQYTTLLFTNDGTPYPYLVTGVLSNRVAGVEVARVKDLIFTDIDYETAISYLYSSTADLIGYDWKYYDFDAGSYSVHPDISYLVRTLDAGIFKLRFVGFYNNLGEKGYPTIEYQRL